MTDVPVNLTPLPPLHNKWDKLSEHLTVPPVIVLSTPPSKPSLPSPYPLPVFSLPPPLEIVLFPSPPMSHPTRVVCLGEHVSGVPFTLGHGFSGSSPRVTPHPSLQSPLQPDHLTRRRTSVSLEILFRSHHRECGHRLLLEGQEVPSEFLLCRKGTGGFGRPRHHPDEGNGLPSMVFRLLSKIGERKEWVEVPLPLNSLSPSKPKGRCMIETREPTGCGCETRSQRRHL